MKQYKLVKKNRKTGFCETIWYTGSLKNKPKGWTVIDWRWVSAYSVTHSA